MSYDRNALQTLEITPARFFNLTRLMQDVEDDEDIIKHLTVVDSTMTAQVELLEEEERHIARACAALLRDVNASLRRKNPMRALEQQKEDTEEYGELLKGNHFIAVVHEVLLQVIGGYKLVREISNRLKPGHLMLARSQSHREFETFNDIQQTVSEMQLNQSSVSRFVSGVENMEAAREHLNEMVKNIERIAEGYYNHLQRRHTNDSIPTFDNPIATDLALTIYENIDAHGEIADGKSPDEVSAYTINKANTIVETLAHPLVSRMAGEAGYFTSFVKEHTDKLWTEVVLLQRLLSATAVEVSAVLNWRPKTLRDRARIDDALARLADVDPLTIVAKDKNTLLSREERFNIEFRDATLKRLTGDIKYGGISDVKQFVRYVLERKAELRKFFQDENSFYVCKISEGNPFGGKAPGALEVIPGPRPLANLDEIVGSGFADVKKFIGHIERTSKWHDLFMASSPSKTTDKSNVLLVGPAGCGKSEVLRAVGGDTKSIGIFAQGSDFLTCWLGEAQKNPKRLFEAGLKLQKESRKHVHFLIDEIDSVLNNDRSSGTALNLTLEFQILMDGVVSYPNLSVWGATNNPGRIPMPMLRRFSKVLIVGELSGEERTHLLKHYVESFLPTKDITKKQWEGYAEMLTGATGDVVRKVADHVWRSAMSEFIEAKPVEAETLMKHLSEGERFDVSTFDSKKRKAFIGKLSEHFAVTGAHIEESIKVHLANIAINQEIKTAVETYKQAHEFLVSLRS
jgi:AAA+ superfamily predicted ATPase